MHETHSPFSQSVRGKGLTIAAIVFWSLTPLSGLAQTQTTTAPSESPTVADSVPASDASPADSTNPTDAAVRTDVVNPIGIWTWDQTFGPNTISHELKLELLEERLSGTHKTNPPGGGRRFGGPNAPPAVVKDIALTGDKIRFDIVRRFGNNELTTTYSGVIVGDDIAGMTRSNFGGQLREAE